MPDQRTDSPLKRGALFLAAACIIGIAFFGCRSTKERRTAERLAPSSSPESGGDATDDMLRALSLAADCAGPRRPRLPWCVVAEGWPSGTAGNLISKRALLGLRVQVSESADNRFAILHQTRLAALAIRTDAGRNNRAALTELVPDNDAERAELSAVLPAMQDVLDGSQERVALGTRLYRFIALEGSASNALDEQPNRWRFRGRYPTEIRRVGALWCVVERSRDRPWAFYVSVMSDRIDPE